MISFSFILNYGIRPRFLYNDMVSHMHHLPISGNKKNIHHSEISKKKITPVWEICELVHYVIIYKIIKR